MTLESGRIIHTTVVEPSEKFLNASFGRECLSLLEREKTDWEMDFAAITIQGVDDTDVDAEEWEGSPELCEICHVEDDPDQQFTLVFDSCSGMYIDMGDFSSPITKIAIV